MAPWLVERHKQDEYVDAYLKCFPESEPKEDFRDRGALYML